MSDDYPDISHPWPDDEVARTPSDPDSRVKDSPVGPGVITEWTDAGFPKVNGVAVTWCVLEDGRVFDPRGLMDHQRRTDAH